MTKASPPTRRINVGELIGAVVEDASGQRVGHVLDIEVRPKARWEVVNLVLGRASPIDRIGILRAIVNSLRGLESARTVPWSAVDRYADRRIRLSAGASPVEIGPLARHGTAGERRDPATSKGPEGS